ncbi:hypothetical protein DAPPUDRAFT_316101 [Daphnia pulex]|uniref:Uncharacterized protein n=1 Tax=Daphnia pulex TaxID=6669 RepID=E9GBQ1_DAPPU|nr:hypothetical protein DAPPUDRAFT_316101 [Daphnia pulex]|eukprot:EFX83001.1 hypothetical protein DAPPUDRAFT_316101 [Daphnia pulex]
MKVGVFIQLSFLISIGYAQQTQELPEHVDKTTCIPLKNLRDSLVQRGLGEARKIRKVQLHLIGSGDIDVSVAIATRFLDEAATRPIVHQCGDYQGTANDVVVTVSCLEEREGADIEGYTGYAIYAQFHGDVANQDAAICQMDIVLYDKYANQKSENLKNLVIITGIVFGLILGVAVGVIIWYLCIRKQRTVQDELPSGVQYWEEEVAKEDVKSKKKPVEDDYDDEVFLS